MKNKVELISPHVELEQSYNDYIAELGNEERYPFPMDLPHKDFGGLISQLTDFSKGKNLLATMVPNSTFWLVDNNEIVAVSHLRHHLNKTLLHIGGHIGLGVRPRYRGLGLSKHLLQLTIQEARARGILTIHVHCYKDNLPSVNMIVACGGVLDAELPSNPEKVDSPIVQKYIVKD